MFRALFYFEREFMFPQGNTLGNRGESGGQFSFFLVGSEPKETACVPWVECTFKSLRGAAAEGLQCDNGRRDVRVFRVPWSFRELLHSMLISNNLLVPLQTTAKVYGISEEVFCLSDKLVLCKTGD